MKIQPEHYAHIKNEILKTVERVGREGIAQYKTQLSNDTRVKDLNMRFRWDLMWASKLSTYLSDTTSKYANDAHIDTALRNIVKELSL